MDAKPDHHPESDSEYLVGGRDPARQVGDVPSAEIGPSACKAHRRQVGRKRSRIEARADWRAATITLMLSTVRDRTLFIVQRERSNATSYVGPANDHDASRVLLEGAQSRRVRAPAPYC
jgi:hypothetical protein